MKRYNEAIVKDTEDFKQDIEGKEVKEEQRKEGLTRGRGEDGEDFSEYSDEGLSNGEAEEGGDFMGSGEMNKEQRKMEVKNEPVASAGKIASDPDHSKIETGTTGSNRNKDYKQEKAGSAESEKTKETNMRNPE